MLQLIFAVAHSQRGAEPPQRRQLRLPHRGARPAAGQRFFPAGFESGGIRTFQPVRSQAEDGSGRFRHMGACAAHRFRKRRVAVADLGLEALQAVDELAQLPRTLGEAGRLQKSDHRAGKQDKHGTGCLDHVPASPAARAAVGSLAVGAACWSATTRASKPLLLLPRMTQRLNAPSCSSSLRMGLPLASSRLEAWAVATTATPEWAASRTAAASSGLPISSAMMTSGDMERSIIIIPSAFGQASITSVLGPTSKEGTPLTEAAISDRSSTMATLLPGHPAMAVSGQAPELTMRARSLSIVVLPILGGPISSVEWMLRLAASASCCASLSAAPTASRAIRMLKPPISRIALTSPRSRTVRPANPTRWPPVTVM
ncbi:hypothetical protein BN871_FX_00030 [Paenibacillus sp. P22]|nr:hypothetical protein BN871_FX_00030 [Paenibacillus sp. P22]